MTTLSVSYDARALTINGERTLLLSGAIHYPRSTPALWPELMRRSKEAGLNAIETYVFWNLHERERGIFDFSDRLDLRRYCELAQEQGLYVILRIGPYICAETNYGGFPYWLRDVPGMQMRTFNQPFMQEMERWVRFLVEYLRPYFAPNGGPIILAQLENEYGNIAGGYGEEGQRYLQWVSDLGARLNLGVPLVMCVGAAEGAIESTNGFFAHYEIARHKEAHPDQPAIWTENWPGWYDTFGYPHHTRTAQNVAYGVAKFIAEGGTGVNYYMWHGGTNFGRDAMYLQTTSYDFHAPLNEFGQPTAKYRHLTRLHTLLREYADVLLQQERGERQVLGEQQSAITYGNGERALTFLSNDALTLTTVTVAGRQYELPAQTVLLLANGQVQFNTAQIAAEHQSERQLNATGTTLSSIAVYPEPLPTAWPLALRKVTVSSTPIEQLQLTLDRTDYCWYSTALTIPSEQEGRGTLTLQGIADLVHVFVDGQFQATTPTPLIENRGALNGEVFTQSFTLELEPGEHELELLCCGVGLIKGDWMIGANMVEERKGLWGKALWNDVELSEPWSLQPGLVGEQVGLYAAGGALVPWEEQWHAALAQPLRWWQLTFARPEVDGPFVVDLGGMNKGLAWLNGRCLGRYWLAPATGEIEQWQGSVILAQGKDLPTQRYYHLPLEWLQEDNTLVLFEELGGDPSSIEIYQVVE